jgi:hypothetical protein
VQTPDKKGENHKAYFWQYSSPGKGVVFDFEMTRGKQVAKEFFKDYGGILHTDGYVAYEKDIGTVYKLPTGTYVARNANVAIDVAQNAAVAASLELRS